MPSSYMSKTTRVKVKLSQAEQRQRDALEILVRAYEAVRSTAGRERDSAERDLGIALARYGQSFRHGSHFWHWSRVRDSIVRSKAQSGSHQVRGEGL